LVNVFDTFQGTWYQPYNNPGMLFPCLQAIFWNITKCELQQPGPMLVVQNIGQVSVVGRTNDWDNQCSTSQSILCVSLQFTFIHLAINSTTLKVNEMHWSNLEVCLTWKMCLEELD